MGIRKLIEQSKRPKKDPNGRIYDSEVCLLIDEKKDIERTLYKTNYGDSWIIEGKISDSYWNSKRQIEEFNEQMRLSEEQRRVTPELLNRTYTL